MVQSSVICEGTKTPTHPPPKKNSSSAHKRSCGKVMSSRMFVCSLGCRVGPWQTPQKADPPLKADPHPRYSQSAGGAHPTRMHTFLYFVIHIAASSSGIGRATLTTENPPLTKIPKFLKTYIIHVIIEVRVLLNHLKVHFVLKDPL